VKETRCLHQDVKPKNQGLVAVSFLQKNKAVGIVESKSNDAGVEQGEDHLKGAEGLTDGAIIKNDIKKDQIITLNDVELDLPKDVEEAREYQYNILK